MGDQPKRYRLKLSRLDFVSLVDDPAQPNAKTLLIKRKGAEVEGETHAKFVKANDELGVAFFWAFTSTNPDGSDHYDLHGDAVSKENLVEIAMDFMRSGASVDEMHDGKATDARAVAFPMDPDVAKAFGVETKTSGLMMMIKVTSDQLAKLKDGTYTGVSIAGLGIREPVAARKSAEKSYLTDEIAGHQHEVCVYEGGSPWMTTEQPKVVVVEPETVVVTDDEAAKRNNGSPSVTRGANVNPVKKDTTMDPEQKIKELEAALAQLKADLEASKAETATERELTDEEKAHAASLSATEQKRFRSLAKSERLAEVKKALEADPVVVTLDGVAYRKSTPGVELAKRLAEQVEKADALEIAKIAGDVLAGYPGDDATKAALIKHARGDEKMLEMLKAGRFALKAQATAKGIGGVADPSDINVDDPAAQLDALTEKHAKEKGVEKSAARVAVLKTDEGRVLYAKSVGRA